MGKPAVAKICEDESHGRDEVREWGHDIGIGEVKIRQGDFVVAVTDGMVIIPQDLVEEVLGRSETLVCEETRIREALLEGGALEQLIGVIESDG